MANELLIQELDFILTHPSCNVDNLNSFYNNCLYIYETVPLIVIVDHLRKENPLLLFEWSDKNELIHKVLSDMEINLDEIIDIKNEKIVITAVDLRKSTPRNGYYKFIWTTDLDEDRVDYCFKRNDIVVVCDYYGEMETVGISKHETFKYILYLKIKEEHL